MKGIYKLLLFALLLPGRCFAQALTDNGIVLHKLPLDGVLLEKGWRYSRGDNPDWAKPNFDDHDWDTMNLNQSASQFLLKTRGTIVWLRLQFTLDSVFQNSELSLLINQYGASGIYVDGRLLQYFGSISPKEFISFNPHNLPLPFSLSSQLHHLLAIRFACSVPSKWVLKRATVSPLVIRLQSTETSISSLLVKAKQSRISTVILVIYAVFGLLFLTIYLFYRRQFLNLFFSIFNIAISLFSYLILFLNEGQYNLKGYVVLQLTINFLGRIAGSSVMVFILLALFQRVPLFFKWFLLYILTADFVINLIFTQPELPIPYLFVVYGLHACTALIFLWLTIRAFRNWNLKDWFIGLLGLVSFIVNFNYFLLLFWGVQNSFFEVMFPLLTLPSMIIYLSLKYANVNTSLEKQLVQVKKLSEENLQNEQEKQQILANQNEMLEKQVARRTAELEQSLGELKAAQTQLIQSAKMASLGELTAGIAHEIQNPLNFVNNFSDVNKELLIELKNEIDKENLNEVKAIANDVIENEEKINHHGKRADAIVKNMLQHSRTSKGEKQLTDINALADEYLRLSYHGLRAKDKDFNAGFTTSFDESIGKIEVIPQDMGRVLLNLFNNAFYAVNERKKIIGDGYEPTVQVSTTKTSKGVEIKVKDNGNGIPEKVVDKIFQPFFTTKPTGEGTGLGLSLSYDIITKGHGGELNVDTKEGEYTVFKIILPAKTNPLNS